MPDHLRRYCGNMDEQGIPIRIALYGQQEIENWSYYGVFKARDLALPGLSVPKPKD